VAQYRAGQYQAALETLTASDKAQSARLGGSHPADLAFLALAQHHLGHGEPARDALARLRDAVKGRWARDAEAQAFLREAAAAIEGPTGR
jgi:hypothetical protein